MTDAAFPAHPSTTADQAARTYGPTPLAARVLLLLVVAASIAVGLHSIGPEAPARSGADLTNLLRFMAALKGVMALAALAAVYWRLAAPVTAVRLVAYAAASSMMGAGPGLIWGMDHVGLGALMLHGGLFAAIALLWRDPDTSALLRHTVETRSKRR